MTAVAFALIIVTQGPPTYQSVNHKIDEYSGWQTQEREVLRHAGDKAAKPLIRIVEQRLLEVKSSKRKASTLLPPIEALCESASIKYTATMHSLCLRVEDNQQATSMFVRWLARVGEPRLSQKLIEQHFLRALKPAVRPANPFSRGQVSAEHLVIGLVRSADSRSIKLLISTLKDATAKGRIRNYIYQNLAATGDNAAISLLSTIRQGSRQRLPIPSVASPKLGLPHRPSPIKARHVDDKGIEWGLVSWDELGSLDDVWLVRRDGAKWVRPLFTGYNAYWDTPDFSAGRRTVNEDQVKTAPLLEGGGWIKEFIGNPELERDSDQDGYTDVIEKWLGLEPNSSDSDQDGLKDSLDKNPHTPATALSVKQQVLRAAFDAVTVGTDSRQIAFLSVPSDVESFEVTSWKGLVLPRALRSKFLSGISYSVGRPYKWTWAKAWQGSPFRLSSDQINAQVLVEESSGSDVRVLLVVLKRFGQAWLPLKVEEIVHIVS